MIKQLAAKVLRTHLARFLAVAFILTILPTQTATAGEQVPYRGAAAGQVISRDDLNGGVPVPFGPAFRRITSQAVGNFTHVGRSTLEFIYDVSVIVEDGIPYLIGEGWYVLTAANGDTLSGPFLNKQNFITGEFTIDSGIAEGTGRFEGATGELQGAGQYFIETDTFEYVLEGTITTVGSRRGNR